MIERAAWVPDDVPDRPWDEAVALAVEWIEAECSDRGDAPVLVTNTRDAQSSGPEQMVRFGQRYGATTPASKDRFDHGPVLVYVPDDRTFTYAQGLARGSVLVAVEGQHLALATWAAEVGADDLTRPGVTGRPALPQDVRQTLDSVHFFGGTNGWSGPHEKADARRRLGPLVESGAIDAATVAGYMHARGVHERGVRRIREILQHLTRS